MTGRIVRRQQAALDIQHEFTSDTDPHIMLCFVSYAEILIHDHAI